MLLAGESVEDHIGAGDAGCQRFSARGLDCRKTVGEHCGQDLDHLAIAIVRAGKLASDLLDRAGQRPVFERRAIAESAGLPRQHGHIVPGIISDLIAAEAAAVLTDDDIVLLDGANVYRERQGLTWPIGIGVHIDWPPDRAGGYRVAVAIEADQAGLRHRGRCGVEAVERTAIGNEAARSASNMAKMVLPFCSGCGCERA